MNSGLNKQAKKSALFDIFLWKPASRGGDDFSVIGYLFRQERLFQVFGLYLLEKIGVALPHLKVRRIFFIWGIICAPRHAAFFIYTATPCFSRRI